ncbi:MAG TPA: substrate-binding domain-containing protein [Mariprofundaceae bacterium]|nr:substrate-binding domain-containing protein [Mariprofundaceae bacterium]
MRNRMLRGVLVLWLAVSTAVPVMAGEISPPWSRSMVNGVDFTVPGVDNDPDLHGDINHPALVIFFAGNQYMLVNDLLRTFRREHPAYRHLFAETLPPGVLSRQIRRGGLRIGNMRVALKPDIYTAGKGRIRRLQKRYDWFRKRADYARNRLAIMTRKGNPDHISGWADLAGSSLKLCMPNPATEGIASHAIIPALRASGGKQLVDDVYRNKVKAKTTTLTRIHHRQTPMMIMQGQCAAGAVWYTEAHFHASIAHHPLSMVEIPPRQNHVVTYTAAIMRQAPHPKAAAAFLRFLTGPEGQAIYRRYGFMPPHPAGG